MGLLADLRVMYTMAFSRAGGAGHADRLEAFYRDQAGDYDDFRRRLLHGRERMMRSLPLVEGARLLDLGGGTGHNLETVADSIPKLAAVEIVDLSPSLLSVAAERVKKHGWTNVRAVRADVCTYTPEQPVDCVTFSYSLTMIPDWFRAIDRAVQNLKPGGVIGVVDFYVARKYPAEAMRGHTRFQRMFWPQWFGYDNVFLSPDHVPYLQYRAEQLALVEGLGKVPYLGMKAPYYVFLGRKPSGD